MYSLDCSNAINNRCCLILQRLILANVSPVHRRAGRSIRQREHDHTRLQRISSRPDLGQDRHDDRRGKVTVWNDSSARGATQHAYITLRGCRGKSKRISRQCMNNLKQKSAEHPFPIPPKRGVGHLPLSLKQKMSRGRLLEKDYIAVNRHCSILQTG